MSKTDNLSLRHLLQKKTREQIIPQQVSDNTIMASNVQRAKEREQLHNKLREQIEEVFMASFGIYRQHQRQELDIHLAGVDP